MLGCGYDSAFSTVRGYLPTRHEGLWVNWHDPSRADVAIQTSIRAIWASIDTRNLHIQGQDVGKVVVVGHISKVSG